MTNLNIDILLNTAYEIAKDQFKDKQFTFSAIWSKTWKTAVAFKKEPVENWIGVFYTQLQLDPRFVVYNSTSWRLKEFMNYSEFKKLNKTIFSEGTLLEESFEKPVKTKEKAVETKEKDFDEYFEKDEVVSEDDESGNIENIFDSEI